VRLPTYANDEVIVDPKVAFGLPLVVHGGARVEDLVDRFQAGDSVREIAADFSVPPRPGRGRDPRRNPSGGLTRRDGRRRVRWSAAMASQSDKPPEFFVDRSLGKRSAARRRGSF
jgi:hypothetical protein